MKKDFTVKMLCIAISFCVAPPVWGQQKTIKQDGVSLTYDSAMFSRITIVELKKEPLPNARDRLNVHPANLLFLFYKNSQYMGSIKCYPLRDWSVDDLKAAYPELPERVLALTHLLHDRPTLPLRFADGTPKELPTIQNQMAGQYFLSHVRYLEFLWGSGIGFLVQYAQDSSEYAVGSRLDYQIEGLTTDKKIAVSAYFHVGHPDLPPTQKDEIVSDKKGDPIGEEAYLKYLRRMEALLDGKSEATFRPTLDFIQKLVGSLRFENVDPGGWGSAFDGKEVVIE
jgi:hypothetical protein